MFDNFNTLKTKGAIEIVNATENELVLKKKQFDPQTGEEVDPIVTHIRKEQILEQKQFHTKRAQNFDAILNEFKK